MAHGITKLLRAIPGPERRHVAHGKTPYRRPGRAERKRAQLEARRAARSRAIANGLGRRGA